MVYRFMEMRIGLKTRAMNEVQTAYQEMSPMTLEENSLFCFWQENIKKRNGTAPKMVRYIKPRRNQ